MMRSRGRPNSSDSAATRDTLLQSARRLFAENGFEGTSMALIAQNAGLSSSAAYYYYPNKFAIYESVFMESLHLVWGPIDQALEKSINFAEAVTAFFNTSQETKAASHLHEFLATVSVEAARFPELAVLLDRRTEQQLAAFRKIVDIAVAAGETRCSTSARDDLAELLRGIVVGWAMQYVQEPRLRIQKLPALLRFLQPGLAAFELADGHDVDRFSRKPMLR